LVEIAAAFFGTPHTWVHVIADAIGIDVSSAIATAYPDGVKLVAGAVAVPLGDVNAAALVDVTWSVADATSIKLSYTLVHVVANAIGIRIGCTSPTTDAQGVKLVAIAVAVPFGDVSASTLVDVTWSVADATDVKFANAFVHVITGAIGIRIGCTVAPTGTQGVKLVAVAIAVPLGDVSAAALVDATWSIADATSIKRTHAVVHIITDAIGIHIGCALATTYAQGVKLVAVAIAITFWDRSATAGKYSSWAIANVTGVKRSYTVVHVITDAIGIRVLSAIATTNAQGVKLVPIAIAVTSGDVSASTLEDFTRAVANVTSVKRSYTVVHIITDAIGIRISCTSPTTYAQGVKLVAVAIAISFGDVRTAALVDVTWSVADATSVQLIPITITISRKNVSATTISYSTRTIADAAFVKFTNAFVHVITDAIGICIGCTIATTDAQGVKLVAVAVAVPFENVSASALVDVTWSVADATSIKRAHAVVHIITDAIIIRISCTSPTTYAQGVKLVAVAVAVPLGDVSAAALVDVTWSVADATSIKRTHAVVHVITDAIGIRVCSAIATTDAQGVNLVAIAVAITFWDRSATAGQYSTWSIAHTAGVKLSYTLVHVVANAIGIRIGCTSPTTDAQGVNLVAIAVAVPFGDVSASTLVDVTWSVADATDVKFANAFVHVITDAIGIRIGCTVAPTGTQGVKLVAVAIAVPLGDVSAAALVDATWSIADATSIKRTHAVVHIITDAIGIHIGCALATTYAQGVKLVAVAVAITFWDRSATTGKYSSWAIANVTGVKRSYTVVHVVANAICICIGCTSPTTYTQGVKLVAVAIAVPLGDVSAAALVDVTWSIADATSIKRSYTVVHIITDAIGIRIGCAFATTVAQGVKLVAIAVAVSFWDVSATTLVDVTWSVADATSIKGSYTVVFIVANAIGIRIGCAFATTYAQGVTLVAVAVAVSFWDVRTTALVDVSRSIADATSIKRSYTLVHVIADAIGIRVLGAIATTDAQGVKLVAGAVAVTYGDVRTAALEGRSRAVADATSVKRAHAFVHIITDAIGIRVLGAFATTDAQGVKLVAVAIAVTSGNVRTTTLVDVTWSVANATSIKRSYTVVHIIADAIGIRIGCAVTTTDSNRIQVFAGTIVNVGLCVESARCGVRATKDLGNNATPIVVAS
jgi:ppGpp synthetase/RelA/SpoT-type nucleotidyltranferase